MPKSYDIRIGNDTFNFGAKGGISIGNARREPSWKGRVNTVLVETLHHGAGRILATDPFVYRDTNGQTLGADASQFGFIMPGGDLSELTETTPGDFDLSATIPSGLGAAVFLDADDLIVVAVGDKIFKIDPADDSVTLIHQLAGDLAGLFFTGSVAFWGGQFILGICDSSYAAQGSFTYPDLSNITDAVYFVSHIASTSQGLFWIANRADGSNPPQMYWTDRTDELWASFTAPDFLFGPFFLEIPTLEITGMGVAGLFPIFASADKQLWGFDPTEVFTPLTPLTRNPRDHGFGKNLPYVGNYLLAPHDNGILRFDPRNLTSLDLTPGNHQGSSPGYTPATSLAIDCACSTASGALALGHFGGSGFALLRLELYQDGMFWSIPYQGLAVDRGMGMGFTRIASKSRVYVCGISGSAFKFFRLDLNGPGAQRTAENIAASSAIRCVNYTATPPDINVLSTQIRGFAHASQANTIKVDMELDGELTEFGIIDADDRFVLSAPPGTIPARKFAPVFTFNVTDPSDPPWLAFPLSLDYIHMPATGGIGPDFVTLKFEAQSDYIDRLGGRQFRGGPADATAQVMSQGTYVEIERGDTPGEVWGIVVEDAGAEIVGREEGVQGDNWLVTVIGRRVL